jgi:very-short-patch-repair endonuclease
MLTLDRAQFTELMERMGALQVLNDRWIACPPAPQRWEILREAYRIMLPIIRNRRTNPYFLDWAYNLTPIEQLAWTDIRFLGLPLYPQVPALHYFLDFADPAQLIAVELDGKAFHNARRDTVRDRALLTQGWRTFRIPGKRSLASGTDLAQLISDCQSDAEVVDAVIDWGSSWSEGFFWALGYWYYGKAGLPGMEPKHSRDAAYQILKAHQLVEFPLMDGD